MTEHAHEAAHHAGAAVEHTGAGIKGALSKKLGPMPVGGWLLAVVGGVVVALYFRNKSSANATDLPDATDTPGDFTANDGFDQADPGGTNPGVGGGQPVVGVDQGGNPATPPTVVHHGAAELARKAKTNAGWEDHAVDAMVAIGFGRAHTRDALDVYLHGKQPTAGQELVIAATLSRCGPPPNQPKRVQPPGTKPTKPHPGTGTRDTGQPAGHHNDGPKQPVKK